MKPLKISLVTIATLLVIACTANGPIQTAQVDDGDYGIGGTGIVGTVTGFGSIFINGVEVEITEHTQLSLNGNPLEDYQFSIGETVEILTNDNNNYSHALKANIRHEIIGPVTGYDSTDHSLEILGHKVLLQDTESKFELGQTVAVSGYTDPEGIIHGRYLNVLDTDMILLRGHLTRLRAQLSLRGYALADFNSEQAFPGPVKITARFQHNTLEVQQTVAESVLPFDKVRNWKLEGFAENYSAKWDEIDSASLINSNGLPVQFELNIDDDGRATVHRLDSRNLPRGETTPRRIKRNGQAYPKNQSSKPFSGGSRSTRGNRGPQ